jgi:hypothetical protein
MNALAYLRPCSHALQNLIACGFFLISHRNLSSLEERLGMPFRIICKEH